MSAADPAGGQKYWHPFGGTFATVERTGIDPGSQKWWVAVPEGGADEATTLDGLLGAAAPPGPGGSTFPALTVAP
jgi:hypothetical protein